MVNLKAGTTKPQRAEGAIASLINGVSQQPPNIRFPNQADECINWHPTVQNSLQRRPPLEVQHKLAGLQSAILAGQPVGPLGVFSATNPYIHFYKRDDNESYALVFTGSGIKVYGLNDGLEKTVNVEGGLDYLSSSQDPVRDFFCYTYKDVTFFVNRKVTVQMQGEESGVPLGPLGLLGSSGLSYERPYKEGIVRIRDVGAGFQYTVKVTIGATVVTYTSSVVTTVNATAADIVSNMTAGITAEGGSIVAYSNIIHITHPTIQPLINVSDNRAGTVIASFTESVEKITDLTSFAPNNYIVKVTGGTGTQNNQDKNTADDVYYKFSTKDGSTGGGGTWIETVAPGIPFTLDYATMPHQLVREADGTFTFKQIQWDYRGVGDELTAPDPPFVGEKIHSIFISSNRLGINAGQYSSLSRTNEENYFNFFRATATTTLDTDPVFIPVPSSQVNKNYWAIQWNSELVIFGDSVDASVTWQNALAQDRISIDTNTRLQASPLVRPILSGSSLIYAQNSGEYSLLQEFKVDPSTSLKEADNITESIGSYIPKDIIYMVGRSKGFVCALADGARGELYCYNYSRYASKMLQQAVHKWVMPEGMTIYGVWMDSSDLFLIYSYGGESFLGKIDLSSGASDAGLTRAKIHLDHRIAESICTSIYDSATDRTTITLPWSYPEAADKVFELRESYTTTDGVNSTATYPIGHNPTVESQTANTLVIPGDWSEAKFYVGVVSKSRYVPCPFQTWAKDPSNGNAISNLWQELVLHRLTVAYYNTGAFLVEFRDIITDELLSGESRELMIQFDNVKAGYDVYPVSTGELIESTNLNLQDNYVAFVSSGTKPCSLTAVQWVGAFSDASI